MTILFVFIVCLIASTIGGICGIGGGVVIKPVLDATGVMSVSAASFLSGVTVIAMSLTSVYKNRRTKELDAKCSIPLGIGAAVGGVIGKRLFQFVKAAAGADQVVALAQAALLGVMVFCTLIYVLNKARIKTRSVQSRSAAAGIGLALGVCSSFLGIGGGPMNLAVLYYFFSMGTKQATVNSLAIVLISQTAGFLVSVLGGSVPPFEVAALLAMVSAGLLGGVVSARLHKRLSARQTDNLFAGLLVVILLICVYNGVRAIS